MTTTSATRLLVRTSPRWGAAVVVGALGQAALAVVTPATPAWSPATVATAVASGLLVALVLTVAVGSLSRSAGGSPRWGLVAVGGVLAVLLVAGLTVLDPTAGALGVLAAAALLPRATALPPRRASGGPARRSVTALASIVLTVVLLAVTVLAQALLGLLVTGAPAVALSSVVAGLCAAAALARWTAWYAGRPAA